MHHYYFLYHERARDTAGGLQDGYPPGRSGGEIKARIELKMQLRYRIMRKANLITWVATLFLAPVGMPLVAQEVPARSDSVRKALNQRSEEHTSELQSHSDLVCRLLLEKKNIPKHVPHIRRQVR